MRANRLAVIPWVRRGVTAVNLGYSVLNVVPAQSVAHFKDAASQVAGTFLAATWAMKVARHGLLQLAIGGWLMAGVAAAQGRGDDLGTDMLERLNVLRSAARVPALERDPLLDAAARVHSADMAGHRELVHVSERTGTPADRVDAAGFSAESLGENIANGSSVDVALRSLVASEAHLGNILDADYTHVGIGVVTEGGEGGLVWVTQVFANRSNPEDDTVAPVPVPYQLPSSRLPGDGAADVGDNRNGEADLAVSEPAIPNIPPAPAVANDDVPAPAEPQAPADATVTVPAPNTDGGTVAGYWVFGSGRWWYFPMPPDAVPGDQLEPDLSVVGPPAGYDSYGRSLQPAPVIRGGAGRHRGAAPTFGWSPRRHYRRWATE